MYNLISKRGVHLKRLSIAIIIIISFSFLAKEKAFAEKIIFIRHGEKPLDKEIGQINCKGLNRSLKLPKVLHSKFGKPEYIFAPNPNGKIEKKDTKTFYNRPLATIEPTSIQFGVPVNTSFNYKDTNLFSHELINNKYNNSVIFVSWEHKKLVEIVKFIYTKDKKNPADQIPNWPASEFDSIYILDINKDKNSFKIKFSQDKQDLNNQSDICPFPIESF